MAEKIIGLGCTLGVDIAGGSTFVVIASVININGPGASADDIDTTTLDVADRFKTFKGSYVDPGELSIDIAYDPQTATHNSLATLLGNGNVAAWEITHSDATDTAETFDGYVKGFERTIERDGLVQASLTVKISGNPGFTVT